MDKLLARDLAAEPEAVGGCRHAVHDRQQGHDPGQRHHVDQNRGRDQARAEADEAQNDVADDERRKGHGKISQAWQCIVEGCHLAPSAAGQQWREESCAPRALLGTIARPCPRSPCA